MNQCELHGLRPIILCDEHTHSRHFQQHISDHQSFSMMLRYMVIRGVLDDHRRILSSRVQVYFRRDFRPRNTIATPKDKTDKRDQSDVRDLRTRSTATISTPIGAVH